MNRWRFRQFQTAFGRDVMSDWRRSLLPGRRAVTNTFLKRIAKMESWPLGICAPLVGHKGKWELRWTAEKVEHRIFGYFDGRSFVMLVGCTHKGRIYDPPGAFQSLVDRSEKLLRDEGKISDFEI